MYLQKKCIVHFPVFGLKYCRNVSNLAAKSKQMLTFPRKTSHFQNSGGFQVLRHCHPASSLNGTAPSRSTGHTPSHMPLILCEFHGMSCWPFKKSSVFDGSKKIWPFGEMSTKPSRYWETHRININKLLINYQPQLDKLSIGRSCK